MDPIVEEEGMFPMPVARCPDIPVIQVFNRPPGFVQIDRVTPAFGDLFFQRPFIHSPFCLPCTETDQDR